LNNESGLDYPIMANSPGRVYMLWAARGLLAGTFCGPPEAPTLWEVDDVREAESGGELVEGSV